MVYAMSQQMVKLFLSLIICAPFQNDVRGVEVLLRSFVSSS
jgi:hypothetical protein